MEPIFTLAAWVLGRFAVERSMGRFFFDLQGAQNTNDPTGLAFETELDAFRAAQRLAAEIGSARPQLCGNAWVAVMSRKRDGEAYYVSV